MTIAILLDPVDLLFCRDGRPIVAGEGAAAGSSLPSPQVLAGAVRTGVLRQLGQLPADGSTPRDEHLKAVLNITVRGPLLADAKGNPFIPMPADLVGDKPKHGKPGAPKARLLPTDQIPGWKAPADAPNALALWPEDGPTTAPDHERHRPGDFAPQVGYLTWEGFLAWAAGGRPTADQVKTAGDLWTEETRTQVALSATEGTAEDGHLFSTRYLRLKPGVMLYAEIDGVDALPPTLTLGGDRRQVRVAPLKARAPWPTTGACAVALTPMLLPTGRCPQAWATSCRGLAIPGADPISGWDLAKQAPRAVRWGLRPGSVWHLADPISTPTSIGDETTSGFGWVALGARPKATPR